MSSEVISSLTSVSLNNDHVNDGRGAENVAAEKELQTETEQQVFFMILFCSHLVTELTNGFFFWLHVSHTAQHHPPWTSSGTAFIRVLWRATLKRNFMHEMNAEGWTTEGLMALGGEIVVTLYFVKRQIQCFIVGFQVGVSFSRQ